MSTLHVVFDGEPAFDPAALLDGRALAEHAETLSQVSKKVGAADLYDFFAMEPEDDGDADGDEDDDVDEDDDDDDDEGSSFFSPVTGLEAVAALIGHLEGAGKRTKGAKEVLVDLRGLRSILEKARDAKLRWRIELGV